MQTWLGGNASRTDEILKNCKNLHDFERILSFTSQKSPEPVREHVPFQSRLTQVFSDLDESLGEEENNNFWIGRVDEPTVEKLVLRVEAPARDVVRFLRALLADADTPFVAAKLFVGLDDVLCVAYTRPGAEVTELLLCDLCEACGSSPFLPYYRSTEKPHRVWVGRSDQASSLCEPLY